MGEIREQHLERAAYVYIRQSTMVQVQNNVESKRRQYALVDYARELGWHDVLDAVSEGATFAGQFAPNLMG